MRKSQLLQSNKVKLLVQLTISLAVLAAALYMILSQQYEPGDKHWAYGVVGTLLGFWLKQLR